MKDEMNRTNIKILDQGAFVGLFIIILLVFSSVVKSSYLSFSLYHTKLPACLPTATAACQPEDNEAKTFVNSQIYKIFIKLFIPSKTQSIEMIS